MPKRTPPLESRQSSSVRLSPDDQAVPCDTATLIPESLRSPLLMGVDDMDAPGAPVDTMAAVVFFQIARCIQRTASGDSDDLDDIVGGIDAVRTTAYDLPPGTPDRGELCEIANALTSTPIGADRLSATLLAYSDRLYRESRWHESGIALGLIAMVWAGQCLPVVFSLLATREGRLFRKQLLWEHAQQRYNVAAAVAQANGIDHLWANALGGIALVRYGKGDLPGALAILDQTLAIAKRGGLLRQRARAFQDRSLVYEAMGKHESAVWANLEAYKIDFGDDEERLHILADLGAKLTRIRRLDNARLIFDKVVDESPRWSDRMNAMIELMGIDADDNCEVHFKAHQRWLAPHVPTMPPSMSVDYKVNLAKGMRVFHSPTEAERVLREALAVALEHGLNKWSFVVEDLLESVHDEAVPREAANLPLEGFSEQLLDSVR